MSKVPEWLKSSMKKCEADEFLNDEEKPLKSFLVRNGRFGPYDVLSIKLERGVKHYRIYREEGLFYIFKNRKFDSLDSMIKIYSEDNWNDLDNKQNGIETDVYDVGAKPVVPKKIIRLRNADYESNLKAGKYVIPVTLKQNGNSEANSDTNNELQYTSPMVPVKINSPAQELSRAAAEKELSTREVYSHVLRTSAKLGNLCLSIKTTNGYRHFVIYPYGTQFYIRYHEKFCSIESLIEKYSKNNWIDLLDLKNERKSGNGDVYTSPMKNSIAQVDETPKYNYDYADPYQIFDNDTSYMKTFTRKEAEKYLSKLCSFSYIVRPSDTGNPCLSVKIENGVFHYIIYQKNSDYYIREERVFPTIAALVKFYSESKFYDLLHQKPETPKNAASDAKLDASGSKEMAELELALKPYYSYTLRDSTTYKGCKCIMIKLPQRMARFIIFSSEKGYYIYKDEKFNSIDALIEEYSANQWEKLLNITEHYTRNSVHRFMKKCEQIMINGKEFVVKYSAIAFEYITSRI